jgi:hypothetical protein
MVCGHILMLWLTGGIHLTKDFGYLLLSMHNHHLIVDINMYPRLDNHLQRLVAFNTLKISTLSVSVSRIHLHQLNFIHSRFDTVQIIISILSVWVSKQMGLSLVFLCKCMIDQFLVNGTKIKIGLTLAADILE